MSNDTQIIVLASQKGGSGKTTLSGHLAVEAERVGAGPVALIDTDPQGSLAKWWNARDKETPAFAQVTVPDLGNDIAKLRREGFKLIVVDTPPAITSAITEVIKHADLVIVPTRPSPHDLRAVGPTVDIIEHQMKPLVFAVNAATARARITGETAVALSQHGTVAPVTLHQRVDYAASMVDGRTVGEVNPKSRSATEVRDLWTYLAERLQRIRDSVRPPVAVRHEIPDCQPFTPKPEPIAQCGRQDSEFVESPLSAYRIHPPPQRWEFDGIASLEVGDVGPVGFQSPSSAATEPVSARNGARGWRYVAPSNDTRPRNSSVIEDGWRHIEERNKELGEITSAVEGRWDGVERRGSGASASEGSWDGVERRDDKDAQLDEATDGGWDGVDRRKTDIGPPPGMQDRRKSRTTFGRRDHL